MTTQAKNDIIIKINKGLELNYSRLVAEKRATNQPFVVMNNGKIEYVKI